MVEGYDLVDFGQVNVWMLSTISQCLFIFDFPHGTKDEWLFEQFKEKLQEKGSTSDEEAKEFVQELGDILSEKTGYDAGL